LADAYAKDSGQTIAAAVKAAREAHDRAAAIGAAMWLTTLGPAAEPALEALDAMAVGSLDSYARNHAETASQFIRRSMLVTPDCGSEVTSYSEEILARTRIALLTRAVSEKKCSNPDCAAFVSELINFLEHHDPYVRAGSAELLANLASITSEVSSAVAALQKMLVDELAAEVGIAGECPLEGRLYHWRQERRSPRQSALRALFAIGRNPEGDRTLRAMVAESMHAAIVCGNCAVPPRFSIGQWRMAVAAAGGLSVADPIIRAARQDCRARAWSGDDTDRAAFVAEAELTKIIGQLSGRLV
jgi:hypothetical protein